MAHNRFGQRANVSGSMRFRIRAALQSLGGKLDRGQRILDSWAMRRAISDQAAGAGRLMLGDIIEGQHRPVGIRSLDASVC